MAMIKISDEEYCSPSCFWAAKCDKCREKEKNKIE